MDLIGQPKIKIKDIVDHCVDFYPKLNYLVIINSIFLALMVVFVIRWFYERRRRCYRVCRAMNVDDNSDGVPEQGNMIQNNNIPEPISSLSVGNPSSTTIEEGRVLRGCVKKIIT